MVIVILRSVEPQWEGHQESELMHSYVGPHYNIGI